MQKPIIKADAITNLTDARYFAAQYVDYIGFDISKISITTINAIKEWIAGAAVVAEVGWLTPLEVIDFVNTSGLNVIQINQFADARTIRLLIQVTVIQEVILEDLQNVAFADTLFATNQLAVDWFLLDYTRNGFAWDSLSPQHREQLRAWCEQYPILLNITHRVEELPDILSSISPKGVCVSGSEEEKVGFKSFDEMNDWFDALEEITT
ncbi:MAG: hypothetical protein KA974_00105 [Saprospiraceae bacterium]|nr:hypothetical protein [Saprospiraceae bacterium]MBP7680020.1 hypothetical protein [Saprospiraceae bacterium]